MYGHPRFHSVVEALNFTRLNLGSINADFCDQPVTPFNLESLKTLQIEWSAKVCKLTELSFIYTFIYLT